MEPEILAFLLAIIAVLAAFLAYFFLRSRRLEEMLADLGFRKASQSSKYGKMTEQWAPFMKEFPSAPENFRFIGSPIDGIAFNDDSIVFCEFKAASSQLSEKQKRIRGLVESKKVEWLEFRIE